MTPFERNCKVLSVLIGSIIIGSILTAPFDLVLPIKPFAVGISFWGIHSIMIQTFWIWWKTYRLTSIVLAFIPLGLSLIAGGILMGLITLPFNIWDSNVKTCIYILGILVSQSFCYWLELKHNPRLP